MTPENALGLVIPEGSSLVDAVLTTELGGVPMYSPGVLLTDSDTWRIGNFKATFSTSYRRGMIQVQPEHVYIEKRSLLSCHQVKEIGEFDFGKLDDLLSYIQDNGAITFLLHDKDAQVAFARGAWSSLCTKFKHREVGYFKPHSNYPGSLLCAVTFTSLKHGVPLFADPRKTRGCVMKISAFSVSPSGSDASKLGIVLSLNAILTDEAEGVLVVDGGPIWKRNSLVSDHLIEIRGGFITCGKGFAASSGDKDGGRKRAKPKSAGLEWLEDKKEANAKERLADMHAKLEIIKQIDGKDITHADLMGLVDTGVESVVVKKAGGGVLGKWMRTAPVSANTASTTSDYSGDNAYVSNTWKKFKGIDL